MTGFLLASYTKKEHAIRYERGFHNKGVWVELIRRDLRMSIVLLGAILGYRYFFCWRLELSLTLELGDSSGKCIKAGELLLVNPQIQSLTTLCWPVRIRVTAGGRRDASSGYYLGGNSS